MHSVGDQHISNVTSSCWSVKDECLGCLVCWSRLLRLDGICLRFCRCITEASAWALYGELGLAIPPNQIPEAFAAGCFHMLSGVSDLCRRTS